MSLMDVGWTFCLITVVNHFRSLTIQWARPAEAAAVADWPRKSPTATEAAGMNERPFVGHFTPKCEPRSFPSYTHRSHHQLFGHTE